MADIGMGAARDGLAHAALGALGGGLLGAGLGGMLVGAWWVWRAR